MSSFRQPVEDAAAPGAGIAEDSFDDVSVAAVEGDRSLEKAGDGARLLVCEDFSVGEAPLIVEPPLLVDS